MNEMDKVGKFVSEIKFMFLKNLGFSPLTASIKTGSYEVFSTIFQFYKTHKKDINHVDKTGKKKKDGIFLFFLLNN